MANSLRMNVIAEGVETAEQLALLRQLRCEFAQGYYFSKPIPRRRRRTNEKPPKVVSPRAALRFRNPKSTFGAWVEPYSFS